MTARQIRRLIATATLLLAAIGALYWREGGGMNVDSSESAKQGMEVVSTWNESDQDTIQLDEDLSEEVVSDSDSDVASLVDVNATVVHVVDGDTLDADLDGTGNVRIRLLGVNTPETVDPRKPVECFGKAASDFSKHMMKEGDRIRVEADPQADERDKYGRLLRNLILANGVDYNALLIQEGYAQAYLSFPLTPERKVQLKTLQTEAKAAGKGLWGANCR